MKYILILFICLLAGVSVVTVNNMYTYGYGVNDAFWRVIWSIDEGTIWAHGFKEESFNKIKIGMSDKDILAIMGKPLNPSENCRDGCFWLYTKQDSGTSDFDQRWIVFGHDHKVIEIRKSFFID